MLSSKYSKSDCTGTRVPRNPGAPPMISASTSIGEFVFTVQLTFGNATRHFHPSPQPSRPLRGEGVRREARGSGGRAAYKPTAIQGQAKASRLLDGFG